MFLKIGLKDMGYKPSFLVFLAFGHVLCLATVLGDLTCMDPEGNAVDWFAMYKIPHLKDNPDPLIKIGLGHVYMDINAPKWRPMNVSLNATSGHALYYTLEQMYSQHDSDDFGYILYNDDPPEHPPYSFNYGHTKGVLMLTPSRGVWLVHSLPRFPPVTSSSYSYPHNGLYYGQAFLCVTFTPDAFDKIGGLLLYDYPHIYDQKLPSSLAQKFENLSLVVQGKNISGSPADQIFPLISVGGHDFLSFGKSKLLDKDLYYDIVAPALESDLLVESWQHESIIPSYCEGKYTVENVNLIQLPNGIKFEEYDDHAKWAISKTADSQGKKWTCVGDINREYGQYKRGGGTLCFSNPDVWEAFHGTIAEYKQCKKGTSLN
ncbi:plancitoxin-1 isoform X2 [Lingula anatina]|nr:plancitoxin-1 isoform X2 [Lingula anatina]|eukprot:XP_023931970.1 plancitoxin-1 isoform X2 [Lingula anatina]